MGVIRLLVCDDQEVVREGLRTILGGIPGIEVVGLAANGAELLEMMDSVAPDVVLMDLNMPILNGVQATRQVRTRYPTVKVLVLTTYAEEEWLLDAVRAGAAGYLLKDAPREQLVAAIRGTASGLSHIDPAVAGNLLERVASSRSAGDPTAITTTLSERELDVLRLLGKGMSNAAIADRLYLSEGTVRNYVSSLLAKLDVADRTQAAVLAVRHGLS